MANYDNVNCPICNEPINNGEEIAVCPDCGAPYHKKCIQEKGECVYKELHEQGKNWENKNAENTADSKTVVCRQCGAVNPATSLFCSACGAKLTEQNNQNGYVPPQYNNGNYQNPMGQNPNGQNPNGQNPNGQYNPYGNGMYPPPNPFMPFGMNMPPQDPNEEIDNGITAKEYSAAVGRSTYYFLPRFKMMAKNKSKTMNWAAFLFEGWYFIYRKMYGLGILLVLADMMLSIPSAINVVQTMTSTNSMMASAQTAPTKNFMIAYTICSVLQFALRILCGFIANGMYKKKCDNLILKTRELHLPEEKYYEVLTKKGSTATKLILGLLIGYIILSFGLFFMTLLM